MIYNKKSLIKTLKILMVKNDLNQTKLAKKMGVGNSTISNAIHRNIPSIFLIDKLFNEFGYTLKISLVKKREV